MDLILFGRQGSGKGTQAQRLIVERGYKIFAMSGELKKVIKSGGELGQKIKAIIDAGGLVGDNIVLEIVAQVVRTYAPEEKIIFDGIPRTLVQKDEFEKIMQANGRTAVGLLIEIGQEEAETRMLKRKVCSVCGVPADPRKDITKCEHCGGDLVVRLDDNVDAMRKRLALYESETLPVVEWYRAQEKLVEVDGMPSIEEVYLDITQKLDERANQH